MTPAVADISGALAALLAQAPPIEEVVQHTDDLDRILALPRRTWREDDPRIMQLVFEMSAWLRHPHSTATLRPIQAFALAELYYVRGLLGPMRVGSGKTLVTFLAPTVLGAQRPVLLIPAKLRKKTHKEFERLAKDWRAPTSMRIFSYEEISRDYGTLVAVTPEHLPLAGKVSKQLHEAATAHPRTPVLAYFATDGAWYPGGDRPVFVREYGLLDTTDTDLFLKDECHRLKNPKAACTRKVDRFVADHPTVTDVDLSGTLTKDKVQDYAHVARWALKSYAPVPTSYKTIQKWGNALNVKVSEEDRVGVGALLELATEEERRTCDPVTAARRGFRRRLIETPGVVAYAKQYDGASLLIEEAVPPKYAPCTEEDFVKLRTSNLRADDSAIDDGPGIWAYARQRALGFFYVYDPPPPMPWKNARTEWGAAVRQALKHGGQRGIDSELQVAKACTLDPKKYSSDVWIEARRAYYAWREIKSTFVPRTVAIWRDDAVIELVAKWMANHRGLVWVEQIEFAERLSKVTGAPYFHEKGEDSAGRFVEEARPGTDGSVILSIESNNEGRNLQEHWSENYFTMPPKGGNKCEQTLGRTHRDGQTADEVTCEVLISCREAGEAWLKILDESRYMTDTTMEIEDGAPLPAKVFYADVSMPDEDELSRRSAETARFAGAKIR